jgi:hypothetical protein
MKTHNKGDGQRDKIVEKGINISSSSTVHKRSWHKAQHRKDEVNHTHSKRFSYGYYFNVKSFLTDFIPSKIPAISEKVSSHLYQLLFITVTTT